jgi:pheromone shutdown protein TraB
MKFNFKKNKSENKNVTNNSPVSDLQRAGFILSIIGVFIPVLSILAIVFGALTKKEKPNNWRAKWSIGLGIFGFITTLIVFYLFISIILAVIGSTISQGF